MDQRLPIHKYRRVRNEPSQKTEENLIRLKARPRAFVYAAYAGKLLFEGKHEYVILNATGPATFKAIQTVEFLRHRVKGLHAAYNIESTVFEDRYEPKEQGLDPVTLNRNVPTITVKLTLTKGEELKNNRGYMSPLAEDKLLDEQKFRVEINEHFSKPRVEVDNNERRGGRGFRGRRGVRRGNYNRDDRDRKDERDDRRDDRDHRRPRRGDREYDRDDRRPVRNNRDDRRDEREYDRDHRRPRREEREYDRDHRRPRRNDRDDRHDDRDYRRPRRGDREERNDRHDDRDYRRPRRGDRDHREPRRDDRDYDRDFRGRDRGGNRSEYRGNRERKQSGNARGSNTY